MKKEKNIFKSVLMGGGVFILSACLLACVYILKKEPEETFTPTSPPESTPVTSTWTQETATKDLITEAQKTEPDFVEGSVTDDIQVIVSETEDEVITDFSGSTPKVEDKIEPPAATPAPVGDITNPDIKPTYPETVPTVTPPGEDSHPGQVYDPVFGWITTGETIQNSVDNDGDINKQLGTMGN